jgi:hypothetical protein
MVFADVAVAAEDGELVAVGRAEHEGAVGGEGVDDRLDEHLGDRDGAGDLVEAPRHDREGLEVEAAAAQLALVDRREAGGDDRDQPEDGAEGEQLLKRRADAERGVIR